MMLLANKNRWNRVLMSIAMVLTITGGRAYALPDGENIISGDVRVNVVDGDTLNINQNSSKAIVEWQSFDIDTNETVNVFQPTHESILLNRVLSEDPSKILGHLNANGHVWVLNSGGVIFGDNAKVDVSGLLATTADVSNADFLSGTYDFDQSGLNSAIIVNKGDIKADGGVVALLAPNVSNDGTIRARFGKIVLASADTFTIDFYGDGLINIALSDVGMSNSYSVMNSGDVLADAGRIEMSVAQGNATVERLIENKWTGRLQANSIGTDAVGHIILGGGTNDIDNNTTILNSGAIEAAGLTTHAKGGQIEILGDQIALLDGARIDASGAGKGGQIKIGGEYLGKGDTKQARATVIQPDVVVKANGGEGEVIVWSNEYTNFQGTIEADGGNGFVETSSKEILSASGSVFAEDGQWLLDPGNIEVRDDAGGAPDDSTITGPIFDSAGVDSVVTTESIETGLGTADVTLLTSGVGGSDGDITVTDTIQYTGAATRTLTLRANDDIIIDNATIDSTTGALNVILNSAYDRVSTTTGDGFVDIRGSSFSTNGGDFVIGGGADPYLNPVIGDGGNELPGSDPAILLDNSPINTQAGDVIIRGINSALLGSLGSRNGVSMANSNITTTSGDITIFGQTDHNATFNRGVQLSNSNIQTTLGSINLEGVGTNSQGIFNTSGTTISQSGTSAIGDITITGTTNGTTNAIEMTAGVPALTFANNLNITGNGGSVQLFRRPIQKIGTGPSNINIQSDNDVLLQGIGATNITTTGDATNLTVVADRDGNGTGNVVFSNLDTNVNGGDIVLSGVTTDISNSDLVSNNTGSGNITIRSDDLILNTADSTLNAAQNITISPLVNTTNINLGTGPGGLDISSAEFSTFSVGDTLTVGSTSGTGTVNIDNVDLTGGGYDLTVYGGATTVDNGLINDGGILLAANGNQNIVLNNAIISSAAGDAITLNATGNFINNFGGGALNPGVGRFLVYTNSTDNAVLGGLTGQQIFGETFVTLSPLAVGGGVDSFIFAQTDDIPIRDEILIDPIIPSVDDTVFTVDDFIDEERQNTDGVLLGFNNDDDLSFSFDGLNDNTAVVFNSVGYGVVNEDYTPQLGDYIRTGLDFGFMFESDENAIIKMTRSSSLRVKKVFYSPNGNNSQYFKVEGGAVGFYSDREKHKGEVKTILPGVAIKVTGTCYIVDLKKETNTTNIILFGGGIELYIKGTLVKLNHPIQMISFGSDGPKAVDPVPLSIGDVHKMFEQKPEIIPNNAQLLKCGVPQESL